MFEAAQLGHTIDKDTYHKALPSLLLKLKPDLLIVSLPEERSA